MRALSSRIFLWIVALMYTLSAYGQVDSTRKQTSSIAGRAIVPQEINAVLPNGEAFERRIEVPASFARVELVVQGDTLREEATRTGNFAFKDIRTGPVRISVSYGIFEPFSENVELMPGENVVIVLFQKQSEQLPPAVVKAEKPVVTQHGDTLVYHADAVVKREGDYAMDLLRQFPGVEVDDNEIRVTGKAVVRSYVNGALIFGLDPKAPMEYLKGEELVAMKVYDEANPEDRVDGRARDRQRVIDIITKNPIFSALDMQARGIAGADWQPREDGTPQLRYTAGVNAHFFSELRQFQLDAVTGNVGMRSSTINLVPGPISTNMDNTDFKLGYNRYWQSSLYGNYVQMSYSFGHQKTKSRSHVLGEYFETAETPGRTEDSKSESIGLAQTHNINTSAAYRTGKHFIATWNQILHFSRNRNEEAAKEQISISGGPVLLRDQHSQSAGQSWSLQENVSLGFVGNNRKQLPRIDLSMRLGRDNSDSWDLDTLASSYSKRYLTRSGNRLSQLYSARISQSILRRNKVDLETQKNKNLSLTGEYALYYSSQDKLQEAYDLYQSTVPLLNTANTYDFTYSSLVNSLSINTFFASGNNNGMFSLLFNLTGEAERIIDQERIPVFEPVKKLYLRVRPTVSVNFKGWAFNYSTFTQTPSVEQLRHWVNDANPLSLIAGNPGLKQSYSHSLSLGWNKQQINIHALSTNISTRLERYPIVNKILFFSADDTLGEYDDYKVKAGSTLLRSVNADYGLYFNASLTEMSRWGGKWKTTTRISPSVNYSFRPQYFGEVLDRTEEWMPGVTASSVFYPAAPVMVSLNTELSYIHAWNQARSLDSRALRGSLDGQVEADFLKIGFFKGQYSWNVYKDFTNQAMSCEVHRLYVSLGVSLLKDKALRIAVSGVDLLRGGAGYGVQVGPSSITRTWTPVYGRYFVIDISYRFNNTGNSRGFTSVTLPGM